MISFCMFFKRILFGDTFLSIFVILYFYNKDSTETCFMAGRHDEALNSYSDILVEFLEVAIHHILYLRELYPRSSFTRKKLYGISVQVSIHPGVRKYVADILKATRDVLQKNELKKLSVNVLSNDSHTIERHFIHLIRILDPVNGDPYYTRLESSLRRSYLKQSQALGSLKPLPSGCRYSIHLHTTEMGTSLLEDDRKPQDFPFISVSEKDTKMLIPGLLPIYTIQMDDARLALYSVIEEEETVFQTQL